MFFVLTHTCSASEAVSLRGANIEVIQIGENTCGKPYGFYPTDKRPTSAFNLQELTIKALVNMPMALPPKTALAVSFNPCPVQSPMILAISLATKMKHYLVLHWHTDDWNMPCSKLNDQQTGFCTSAVH